MRYLLFSDIHANLEALDSSLAMAQGKYDQVLCLGDLVGYGPDPNAVIDRVRPLASLILRGNHDKACAGLLETSNFNPYAREACIWTLKELTGQHIDFLRQLPAGPAQVDGIQFVHGSPRDEDEYVLAPGQALAILRNTSTLAVCYGHTHDQGGFIISAQDLLDLVCLPKDREGLILTLTLEAQCRYLLNPGSIGQPRDGDWRAAFAILDAEKRTFSYYRAPYELSKTQEKMKRAGLPNVLIQRLQYGR